MNKNKKVNGENEGIRKRWGEGEMERERERERERESLEPLRART
jgi:hypothetical protein